MMVDALWNDVRFAARTLIKSRGFALVAIVTLGLGIGANTAIFSVIYGVLLKPLPYADSDRLVLIRQSAPPIGRADTSISIKEFFTYRDQLSQDSDGLVEFHQMNFDLLKRGEPDRVNTGVVSPKFFDVLGIRPILGRSFADDDRPGAHSVRSACMTSTRAARAAGISDATTAATSSTAADATIGIAPGSVTLSTKLDTTRATT